jgi:hypothetical protein
MIVEIENLDGLVHFHEFTKVRMPIVHKFSNLLLQVNSNNFVNLHSQHISLFFVTGSCER